MTYAISVIIPTFNRPQALHRAIESALAQTQTPLEILVCEDGSSAETEQVVNNFGHPAVKWLPGPHAGYPAIPRNRGIRLAQGEFIAFLDDDDEWLPIKLEKQLAAMNQDNFQACCTNAWHIRPGENDRPYFDQSVPEKLTFQDLLKTNMVICSSAIVHRSILYAVGGFPEASTLKVGEDYALWLRIASQTNWAYVSEPLTRYTDMPSQSIRREGVSVFEQKRRVLNNFQGWAHHTPVTANMRWKAQQRLVLNSLEEIHQSLSRLFTVKKP